jgi:hypothetical protein
VPYYEQMIPSPNAGMPKGRGDYDPEEDGPEPTPLDELCRPWLADSCYSYDEDGEWSTVVSRRLRVARRDHKDGKIFKGDTYRETVTRYINDETGASRHGRHCWLVECGLHQTLRERRERLVQPEHDKKRANGAVITYHQWGWRVRYPVKTED